MQANTKLNAGQKEFLKTIKARNPKVTLCNNGQTTIAYMDRGNTVEFSLSVAAPTEKKFRRKVGEYFALLRFNDQETVKMASIDFHHMMVNTLNLE